MKNVFSLLLVGVVAVSMFSFISPSSVEAAEEDGRGYLHIYQADWYAARFDIKFLDSDYKDISETEVSKKMAVGQGDQVLVPVNTEYIIVYLYEWDLFKYNYAAELALKACEKRTPYDSYHADIKSRGAYWNASITSENLSGWEEV